MTLRNLHPDLVASLQANEPFNYFHLVKFEKPKKSGKDGAIAALPTDYAYITDAPHNVSWDEGTGTFQNYISGKLLSVGTVTETTEARASNMSIKLATTALGAYASTSVKGVASGQYLEGLIDYAEAGFREGDKVKIQSTNNNLYVIFDRFAQSTRTEFPNSRIYVTAIDGTIVNDSINEAYEFDLVSEELNALVEDKTGTLYSNYINREVFIYKAHANPSTGVIIGSPFLIFKGIIAQGSLQEKPDKLSTITWGLSSHWGDFVRIQGRLTSDDSHRALSITGKSDPDALIRPDYAYDYGFIHSEKSINVLASFQSQELRYKMVKRGGLAGWLGGKKMKEYYETVDNDVDLRFNLAAKFLPVVYGVQKVSSIPIFADVDNSDPSVVYAAYALCEGEIGGIYDIHVEEQPSVCSDATDSDARAPGTENVDVVCYGRMDKGDVLSSNTSYVNTSQDAQTFRDLANFNYSYTSPGGVWSAIQGRNTPSNTADPKGLIHESQYQLDSPEGVTVPGPTFIVHTGKSDQQANQTLVAKSAGIGFKIQNDYYEGDAADYWSNAHRLLDTANVVATFNIGEGEETIPKYEFVVKGKYINCYNYDQSFPERRAYAGQDPSLFSLGDTVTLHSGAWDQTTGSVTWTSKHVNAEIIDKWVIYDKEGVADTRFRWRNVEDGTTIVNLGTDKLLKMTKGTDTWIMYAYDFEIQADSVQQLPTSSFIVNPTYTDNGGVGVLKITLNDSNLNSTLDSIGYTGIAQISVTEAPNHSFAVTGRTGNVLTLVAHSGAAAVLTPIASGTVFLSNAVKVSYTHGITSTTDISYITIYRTDSAGVTQSIKKKITAIDTTSKVLYSRYAYPDLFAPDYTQDTYIVGLEDQRVSINPAMQLLDYISSTRYGRGLKIGSEVSLSSFQESARLCDDASNIKVVTDTLPAGLVAGSIYRINNTSDSSLIFKGTVAAAYETHGGKYQIEFTDCIGKLGYKWTDWRVFKLGDIVWSFDQVSVVDSIALGGANPATITKDEFNTLADITTITLAKVSGAGPSIIDINVESLGGIKGTNTIIRSWSEADQLYSAPGYSLYDSDNVKYWKYLGWDEPEQRYATRHQMNQIINTSSPIFDNINSMLKQFNGILRYSNGLYELDIKTEAPTSFTAGEDNISEDDIIGAIKLDDKGQKGSFNNISANIVDPQNKFGAKSISFFNSTYLKEDKGVTKQGTYSMPGVSNYYNARTNIIQFLDESRYGITAKLTLDPKSYLLRAGQVIAVQYNRFDWLGDAKTFRIKELALQPNGEVLATIKEHNNNAYLISYSDRSSVDNVIVGTKPSKIPAVEPITNLVVSDTLVNEIKVSWDAPSTFDKEQHQFEIYYAEATKIGDIYDRKLTTYDFEGNEWSRAGHLDTVSGTEFIHSGFGSTTQGFRVFYYWVRMVKKAFGTTPARYSLHVPDITAVAGAPDYEIGSGIQGLSYDAAISITVSNSNEEHTLPVSVDGTTVIYDGSGTVLRLYFGADELFYDGLGVAPGTWTIDSKVAVPSSITIGSTTDSGGYVTIGSHNTNQEASVVITYTFSGVTQDGKPFSGVTTAQTITKGAPGAATVSLSSNALVISHNSSGGSPSPSGATLTAKTSNITSPLFRFSGTQAPNSDTTFISSPSYSWLGLTNYANYPEEVKVEVADSANPSVPLGEDTITIVGVKEGLTGASGANAISVFNSNGSHTVIDNGSGNLDYTGSGTTIQVYEGPNELTYDGVGTSVNTWTIGTPTVAPSGAITPSTSFVANGKSCVVGTHTDMVGLVAVISYPISGTLSTGATFSGVITDQSIDRKSEAVNLRVDASAVAYDENGGTPIPSTITATATAVNMKNPYFQFIISNNTGTIDSSAKATSFVYSTSAGALNSKDGAITVLVNMYEGNTANLIDSDTVVIPVHSDGRTGDPGDSPITIQYTNSAHTVSVDNSGVEDWAGSGGTFTVGEENTPYILGSNSWTTSYPTLNGRFNLGIAKLVGDTLSSGTLSGNGTATAVMGVWSGNLTTTTLYRVTAYIRDPSGILTTKNIDLSLAPAVDGADGIAVDGLTVSNSNSNHTIVDNGAGLLDYTGSGTTIQVYEGATSLTYDGVGTGAGTWKIASANETPVNSIVPSTSFTLNSDGKSCDVGQHIDMTGLIAVITYSISGTLSDGVTAFSGLLVSQSIDRKESAVNLSLDAAAVSYDKDGGTANPSAITATATAVNMENPYFQFTVTNSGGTIEQSTKSTSSVFTTTTSLNPKDGPISVLVDMYEGNITGTTTDSDTVIIPVNSDGQTGDSAVELHYTNPAYVAPVDNAGVTTWLGSGGIFTVVEGSNTSYFLGSNAWTASYPTFNSRFNLSIAYVSGDTLVHDPVLAGNGTATATMEDWSDPLTTVTTYRVTAYIRDSKGATFTRTIDLTLTPADQGVTGVAIDGLTVHNSNDNHTIPVSSTTGLLDYTDSGTTIQVYEGVTPLVYDATPVAGQWKLTSTTVTPSGGITPGTIGIGGVVSAHSSLTASSVVITYTIEGLLSDGTAFSGLIATQSIDKKPYSVDLSINAGLIVFDDTGNTPVPGSFTATAKARNLESPEYRFRMWYSNGTLWANSGWITAASTNFNIPSTDALSPYTIEVNVRESGTTTTLDTDYTGLGVTRKGDKGDAGAAGAAGAAGTWGAVMFQIPVIYAPARAYITSSAINTALGRNYAVYGDIAIVVDTTGASDPTSIAWKFTGTTGATSWTIGEWVAVAAFIDGDLVVEGSIDARELTISNTSGSTSGIHMDGANNRIDIWEGTQLRVRLGQL